MRVKKTINPKTHFKRISDTETLMWRVFDAKPSVVYKAMTDPMLMHKWWGPGDLTTVVEMMDVRPGGKWRVVQRSETGEEFAFRGEYLEVIPNKKTVSTFEFEAMAGHIATETVTFEAFEGKTKITTHSVFQNKEDVDGMLQSGMLEGASETYDRFEKMLLENNIES
jgi:uncharacterized protein YndB with AHSA1/START domain